jgi:ATP-dependent DNA helicase RecG
VIVLGVSDDGVIQNLDALAPEVLDAYRRAAFDHIKPHTNVNLEEVRLSSGELIFLYHIDQDYERVFSRNDTGNEDVYLRIGASNK